MIITISREYGSGGAEIAHLLAERLGVPCYDKTVAQLTSAIIGFPKASIENAEDKVSGVFDYIGYDRDNLPVYDRIYLKQREAIIELAQRGDCVIVGRCAAPILREEKIPTFDVFIYAPKEERIARLMQKHGWSAKEAEKAIRQKDAYRKNYYRRYAYCEWGERSNYHLLVNSTVGTERAVEAIALLAAAKE